MQNLTHTFDVLPNHCSVLFAINPTEQKSISLLTFFNDKTFFPLTFLGEYLGMTLPIVTVVHTDESHSVISHDVTVAYYVPTNHQAQPPQPLDSDIIIEVWPATIVYARSVENSRNITTTATN